MLPLLKFVYFSDPPDPPQSLQVLEVGARWATLEWLPPGNVGPLPPLSFYEIVATPHLVMYHDVINQSNSDDSIPVGTKQTTSRPGLEGRNQRQELLFSDDHSNAIGNRSLSRGFDPNTTCIEVLCEVLTMRVDASSTVVNVTGLVPALGYELVVHALSSGTSLISRPSDAVSITTKHSGKFYDIIFSTSRPENLVGK